MDKNKKIWVGAIAGIVLLCAVIGITGASFRAGMMMSENRNGFAFGPGRQQNYVQPVPQPVAPAVPQDDQPQAPRGDARRSAPQVQVGPAYGNNDMGMNRGHGFGVLSFIGGIFRFIGTLLLIGLAFFFIRMMFFKRGWGPGRWGWGGLDRNRGGPNGNHGVPPHFEEWHKRMHEQAQNPQQPAPNAPDASASKPTDGDVTGNPPQDPRAI